MLTIDCEICDGWKFEKSKGWYWEEGQCTNENCDEGRIPLDENEKVYVNVYSVTRHFGGHEEGGWYYDWFECLETIPCKNKFSSEIQEDLESEYKDQKRGDISSVLGGVDIVVYIENTIAKSQTKERPYYE